MTNEAMAVIVWGPECTLDISRDIRGTDFELTLLPDQKDIEVLVSKEELQDLMERTKQCITKEQQIGGSPFYSLYSSSFFREKRLSLPVVVYNGLLPKSVKEFVHLSSERAILESLLRFTQEINNYPGTLSLEGSKAKYMASYPEGRDLIDLDNEEYIKRLHLIVEEHPDMELVIALGGLNKGQPGEYRSLIERIKNEFAATIFIGTNSFSKLDKELIARYFYEVIQLADIVSFNEMELDQVYMAVHGDKDINRVEKLRELPFNGVKITHSAYGAIMMIPQELAEFKMELKNTLQASVDGAACYLERGKCPDLDTALDYSRRVKERQDDGFKETFGLITESMVSSIAPLVRNMKGSMVGVGARFDGYLTSLLLSDKHVLEYLRD